MDWTQIGGSLAGILALVAIARMLRLGESRIDSPDTAITLAEERLAGFVGDRAIVSTDGRAALVAGNGTIAVLKRHGAKVAARRLLPPLRLREAIEGVAIETGERLFGPIVLRGVLVDEVRALTGDVTVCALHSI
ncbi:hypothetical protein [Sphingomonas sp. RS2018]